VQRMAAGAYLLRIRAGLGGEAEAGVRSARCGAGVCAPEGTAAIRTARCIEALVTSRSGGGADAVP
jgi:hypothetical protein